MKRKVFAPLAVAVMLLAACGREGEEQAQDVAGQGTAGPTATARAKTKAAATDAPADAGDGGTAATSAPGAAGSAGDGDSKTPAPAPKAASGEMNRPKAGSYTYSIEGKASDPFNPTAGEQSYKGEMTAEISHSGDVTTREQTNSERAGRTTVRTKREQSRVLLLSFKQETAQGDFSCTFDPPPVITRIPVKPEKFPTQKLSGQGNACGGKLDITVQRQETVKDANGTSWNTWRVLVDQTTDNAQFKIHSVDTRWVSPDLGMEVRSDGKTDGEIKAGATSQKFSGTAKTALRDRP